MHLRPLPAFGEARRLIRCRDPRGEEGPSGTLPRSPTPAGRVLVPCWLWRSRWGPVPPEAAVPSGFALAWDLPVARGVFLGSGGAGT